MKKLLTLVFITGTYLCSAQPTFYDVVAGPGNGLRFWNGDDSYKIHMGSASEYFYGPVTDYSIKTNMSSGTPGRGWTWGVAGQIPIAAINTLGNMQIAGNFRMVNNSEFELGVGITKEGNAGKITYQGFSDALDIVGAGTNGSNRKIKFWNEGGAEFTGNVGIGTAAPVYKLQVAGGDIGLDEDQPLRGGGKWLISGNSSMVTVGTANPNVGIRFNAGDVDRMTVNGTTGNVGIGTTSPDQKLTVNGTIHSKEVKVDLSVPAPDYVFEKAYKLPTLEEIKIYIDQHKHLPEVPSAKDMEASGVLLGEMNMLLLKKIEELTLHVIYQNDLTHELIKTSELQQKMIMLQAEEINKLKIMIEK